VSREYYYWRENLLRSSFCSDVATTPFVRCGTFLKRSTLVPCHEWIYTFHFIFLFEVSTYLLPILHQEDAKSISKSTFDSPSHWGIYLHYEKKQGPGSERPFLCALLTSQTGKVVGLRLDCTDCEFSRQCVEDAMYANEHNQTSGQRWLERRRKQRRWRYDEVRRRCTMTTEERRSVKAEDLVDGFPTRNRLQGSR